MAFVPIDPTTIEVGDPITKELFDLIRSNFEDHENRIQIISGGSGKISLINEDVLISGNASALLTGSFYVEVIQACIVTEGAIQLFAKGVASTGTISIDVKKNTSTNPVGFNSVFSVAPSLNLASATDYQRSVGTINPVAQSLSVGDILKLDITGLPTGLDKFRVILTGEF